MAAFAFWLLAARAAALEVEVSVEASWPAASLPAELLEGLAVIDRGDEFLRSLAAVGAAGGVQEPEWRRSAARAAESTLCCNGSSAYGQMLSLRARHAFSSAAVEAARGMERADREAFVAGGVIDEKVCPVGTAWAVLQMPGATEEIICGSALTGLVARLTSDATPSGESVRGAPRRTDLDHVLYESTSADAYPEIVGYADIGEPAAAALLLRALVGAADALEGAGRPGRIAFRHGQPAGEPPRAILAGYGLELFTRSADEVAKSTDGETAAQKTDSADGACLDEVADPAELFHGVDIGAMAVRHPGTSSALCHLRQDLVAEAEKPLLPWELTRIGARAAMRAVHLANESAIQGLVSLGEVAQNYPSGWGRALSAGTAADVEMARDLMDEAEAMKGGDSLLVNGWDVPEKQRDALNLLRSQLPLFKAVELLASDGYDQAAMFSLLRDSSSGNAAAPTRIDTGDPRLTDGPNEAVVLETRGQYPLKMFGLGLVIDPCSRKQVEFLTSLMREEVVGQGKVWLRLSSTTNKTLAAFMQKALKVAPGDDSATTILRRFYEKQTNKDEDLCDTEARKRFLGPWKKAFKDAGQEAPKPAELTSESEAEEEIALPLPSACVNGKVVAGYESLTGKSFLSDLRSELQSIMGSMQMMGINMHGIPERMVANFGYSSRELHPSNFRQSPHVLSAWYPGITTLSRVKHVPLAPRLLSSLPGGILGNSPKSSRPFPAIHAVVIPGSGDTVAEMTAEVLYAYEQLQTQEQKDGSPERILHMAVTGGCDGGAGDALTAAGAIRRCLAAAMPASQKHNVEVTTLNRLKKAFGASTPSQILEKCQESFNAESIHPDVLKVDSDDIQLCRAQSLLLDAVGQPESGTAILSFNGRIFTPTVGNKELSLNRRALIEAEEMGFTYGAQLLHQGQISLHEDVVVRMLETSGAGTNPYRKAFALAVRNRAVVEALAARSGDEAGNGEEGQEESQSGNAEAAYNNAPEALRLHIPPPDGSQGSPIQIYAFIDPLGKDAQRLPPLLKLMNEELHADIRLVLRPTVRSEAPLTGYYRAAAVAPAPPGGLAALGDWDGKMSGVRIELPPRRGQLLSALLVAPDAWLCSPVDSGGADLDSIRADAPRASPDSKVHVRYVVQEIFLEGLAQTEHGRTSAGRQLALAPLKGGSSSAGSDSVVVRSGYFQLRQRPGLYKLSLQSKKEESEDLLQPRGLVHLTDLAGRGSLLEVLVGKGVENAGDSQVEERMFTSHKPETTTSQTASFEGSGGDPSVCNDTIHIFSVASGLRYERLLRIMMMSVRQHTKCKLRFWLVENFLSASFQQILPGLAEQVGFAVSRVTYKWPSWLREQTQKQRVIWAYKILFLDVFFPAEVKRVLFIDADQIVRADVQELWNMDIKGHVYGFVPFCGSGPAESLGSSIWKSLTGGAAATQEELRNPDTVGFRFWEQGFWKNHLGTRTHYHISALFVVDLENFRKQGAGDILREVYQSLTRDPHSLANLDQDLPNYIQRQLPIYSLPQEWLWCESWCSEASKKNAKTIDMCQHPSKKEGKLQQARRIAPEWTKYDEQLQVIIDKLDG
eukprot:TRINITY_DN19654_c0_g1_i1.p1 TRINITY_DN19654_c0_g1~~TRINITY_DN19654_c0_g1_i1.p1  ORF type:complete len:1571 (-),score=318.77 TRINITY_DN19654_c0_g1_i1:93-4805(-)